MKVSIPVTGSLSPNTTSGVYSEIMQLTSSDHRCVRERLQMKIANRRMSICKLRTSTVAHFPQSPLSQLSTHLRPPRFHDPLNGTKVRRYWRRYGIVYPFVITGESIIKRRSRIVPQSNRQRRRLIQAAVLLSTWEVRSFGAVAGIPRRSRRRMCNVNGAPTFVCPSIALHYTHG
ncbi:hypothetical protein BC629DRAFT_779287 [Irpex lacteus]|nr:hypothetical protein BC629DRAFT_779287 [Irpex lacteus]